jgi:hypothetical protein
MVGLCSAVTEINHHTHSPPQFLMNLCPCHFGTDGTKLITQTEMTDTLHLPLKNHHDHRLSCLAYSSSKFLIFLFERLLHFLYL